MSLDNPRLRGGKRRIASPWSIGGIPHEIIINIGKFLVHRMSIGQSDISGDDFGTIFAAAVGGEHKESPLGLADVTLDGTAWSVKTVKSEKPFQQAHARFISGRNSPNYSFGIENPHADVQITGNAVLQIWNGRVNESLAEYDDLRVLCFLRNFQTKEFVIFEETAMRFAVDDYAWTKNKKGNFEGHEKNSGIHKFTWQPHGGQFTMIRTIPGSAIKFSIKQKIPVIEIEQILEHVGFENDWIEIVEKDTP